MYRAARQVAASWALLPARRGDGRRAQVVHIGSGPVLLEHPYERGAQDWRCACGACCACLGPSVFRAA